MYRKTLLLLIPLILVAAAPAAGQCTIDFDTSCPGDSTPECDASFTGGSGCIFAGLGNCYTTGSRSYQVSAATPLTIVLATPIERIEVFFAHTGGATSGAMQFFDADSVEVGTPITTAGDCGTGPKPAAREQNFSTPVWRIEVAVSGSGSAWIDTMRLTAASQPVEAITWGRLKAVRYR